MSDKKIDIIENMLNKSQESFLAAIKMYNDPQNRIRIESFCFFMCNAWELLLKAYFLKRKMPITHKNKANRTLSLSDLVKKTYTNIKDGLRINLDIIISLRNDATHFLIPEYAELLHGVFVACTNNYCKKLLEYADINISNKFSPNFLSLYVPCNTDITSIKNKYSVKISKRFDKYKKYLRKIINDSVNPKGFADESLYIEYELSIKRVKDEKDADLLVTENNVNPDMKIIKEKVLQDPNKTHPYSHKNIIEKVREEIVKRNLKFTPLSTSSKPFFNKHLLDLYISGKNIKSQKVFCYEHIVGNTKSYTYSLKLVNKIISDLIEDENLFINLKNKKLTPGAKDS